MHVVTQGGEPLRPGTCHFVPIVYVLCGVSLVPYFKTALHRDRTPLNCHSLFTFYFNPLLVFCLIIRCWGQFRICKKEEKKRKQS